MTDRELDALVAEKVMGWQWLTLPVDRDHSHLVNPATKHDYTSDWLPGADLPRSAIALSGVPYYSTDLNDCFEAQATCIEKVGWSRFAESLMSVMRRNLATVRSWDDSVSDEVCHSAAFESYRLFATASARQRCEAMLKAVG